MSKTAIAKLTGVSRTTVDGFMRTRGLTPSPSSRIVSVPCPSRIRLVAWNATYSMFRICQIQNSTNSRRVVPIRRSTNGRDRGRHGLDFFHRFALTGRRTE